MGIRARTMAAATLLALLPAAGASASGEAASLFIHLTAGETNRAAMAIGFGHQVLVGREMPVTLFLDVEAVQLASRKLPQHRHADGKTLRGMLQALMADGGTVIVCPMCLRNVAGLTGKDLIEGAWSAGRTSPGPRCSAST